MIGYKKAEPIVKQIDAVLREMKIDDDDDTTLLDVLNFLRSIETHCSLNSKVLITRKLRNG